MYEMTTEPRKLYLPKTYQSWVPMAPVSVNNNKSLRYMLDLPNGLKVIVDTMPDGTLEFRLMPAKEFRYIRVHSTTDINNPESYVCRVQKSEEFVRTLMYIVNQINPEKIPKLDRNIGLKIPEDKVLKSFDPVTNQEVVKVVNMEEGFRFLRPFLSTDPIYCGNATTYVFEFPNGYTPIVKSNEDGTFNLSVQVNDGRGFVDLYDIGMELWKHRGMKKLIAVDNDMILYHLIEIFNAEPVNVQSTIFDEFTRGYWDELDDMLDNGIIPPHTDFTDYIKRRFDRNVQDMTNRMEYDTDIAYQAPKQRAGAPV